MNIAQSVRFFPSWNKYDIYQIIGLIHLVSYINEKNPDANTWLEIGSNIGESSTIFLAFPQIKTLHCVDINRSSIEILQKKFLLEISHQRCYVHHSSSLDFSDKIPEASIDVIYIDGDHTYESVKQDISLYLSKIKPGGFICGHDYSKDSWPGVAKAVDELAISINQEVVLFKDSSWLFRKN